MRLYTHLVFACLSLTLASCATNNSTPLNSTLFSSSEQLTSSGYKADVDLNNDVIERRMRRWTCDGGDVAGDTGLEKSRRLARRAGRQFCGRGNFTVSIVNIEDVEVTYTKIEDSKTDS